MDISPGLAAVIVLGNTLSAKMAMSFGWRLHELLGAYAPGIFGSQDSIKKMLGGPRYKNMAKAQLNEAEYAGPMAAMLLYLHTKNVEAPLACTLAAISGPLYFWGRTITGTALPFTPLGAMPRYHAFALLIAAVYGTL